MKQYNYIYIALLLILYSCVEAVNVDIVINKEFLGSHYWMIDTIYGEEKFIQDWIYFTPEEEFYRFSKFRKSYVLDSALTWHNNRILLNEKEIYKVIAIDSHLIELKGAEKTYRAKRWNEFDSVDIERYIKNNRYKSIINGNWKLDSMEIEKTRMPSFCEEIVKESVFSFNENGSLFVYEKDSTSPCNNYSYQINEDEIFLLEYDMGLTFPIQSIERKRLVIKSNYVPKNLLWKEEIYYASKNGFNMYFKKIR